jgi:hypothetical protein
MRGWSSSVWVLLIVNLWEIVGVFFFGWDQFMLAFVYWTENAVIGLYTIPKLLITGRPRGLELIPNVFMAALFVLHYGAFTIAHGLAVAALWKLWGGGREAGMPHWIFEMLIYGPYERAWPIWLGIAGLLYSHGHSFVVHTIRRQELRTALIGDVMSAPYPRVGVMHAAILFGTGLMSLTGAHRSFAVFLILMKIGLDIRAHRKEHAKT